jgi:hypothetical protein
LLFEGYGLYRPLAIHQEQEIQLNRD